MLDLKGKVAVITGGAGGVGFALARTLSDQGVRVAIADMDAPSIETAVGELKTSGHEAIGIRTDVTKQESLDALADEVFAKFGNVHLLFNNAGVGLGEAQRRIWTLPVKDWQWGFAVNVMGIVHGIRAFVPRMIEKGEDGLIVNTSSANGGLFSLPTTPIYAATKAAVTSITEVLHYQFTMDKAKLKAAILFPGPNVVNTRILDSNRNRPAEFSDGSDNKPHVYKSMKELVEATGLKMQLTEPEEVAAHALECIRAARFWMLPASGAHDAAIRARADTIIGRNGLPLPSMGA